MKIRPAYGLVRGPFVPMRRLAGLRYRTAYRTILSQRLGRSDRTITDLLAKGLERIPIPDWVRFSQPGHGFAHAATVMDDGIALRFLERAVIEHFFKGRAIVCGVHLKSGSRGAQ
jgi:hypothetical protein